MKRLLLIILISLIPGTASAATYATWDSANKGTDVVLSNGNLDALNSAGSWESTRSTIGVSSGKWYWEVQIITAASASMNGIANGSASMNALIGSDVNGYGYYDQSGDKFNNNSFTACGATYTTGDIIGVALDMDGGSLKFYKNNSLQCTISGLSGTYYAATSMINGEKNRANFGATALTYTPPAGYNAGLYTGTVSTGIGLWFFNYF